MKVKEESEKAGLKLNIQKTKIMASGPIRSDQSISRVQLLATPWTAAHQAQRRLISNTAMLDIPSCLFINQHSLNAL